MNKPGTVSVKLPVSEFIDRYLISELKKQKYEQAGKSGNTELETWLDSHNKDYTVILASSAKLAEATAGLASVHEQLWDLEDLVRSPEAENEAYFARIARQIFNLNTERHNLKHAIDTELPSLSFGPRLYQKGIV